MKEILIFTPSDEKFGAVKALGDRGGIRVTRLQRAQFDVPLSELLGLPLPLPRPEDAGPVPALYAPPELMVLHGFASGELDVFLAEYRKRGIAPVRLKAVTTLFNLGWTPYDLAEHLREEAERFKNTGC